LLAAAAIPRSGNSRMELEWILACFSPEPRQDTAAVAENFHRKHCARIRAVRVGGRTLRSSRSSMEDRSVLHERAVIRFVKWVKARATQMRARNQVATGRLRTEVPRTTLGLDSIWIFRMARARTRSARRESLEGQASLPWIGEGASRAHPWLACCRPCMKPVRINLAPRGR